MPLALQGLYVIALRGASGLGEGNQTSLTYAYLFAATLVAATASSLSLISSAPLTRRGPRRRERLGARRSTRRG